MSVPRTTTLRTLLRRGAALLVLTILAGSLTWYAFDRAQDGADGAHDLTVPAILEVSAARNALIAADRAAIESFSTDEARVAGPGEVYRSQIAIAGQNLTQAVEDVASEADSRRLQVVQGLLASYTSSIEQAAAIYRQNQEAPLWLADLWNASKLLHMEPGGVLIELDTLAGSAESGGPEKLGRAQRLALDEPLDSSEMIWSTLSWLVPVILLFGLLIVTQVYLTRRFRRIVNPGFLAAVLCLLGVVIVVSLTFSTGSRLSNARDTVDAVGQDWRNQADAIDRRGQKELAELVGQRCAGECGYTVNDFIKVNQNNLDSSAGDAGSVQMTKGTERIKEVSDAAIKYRDYELLIPLGALLAGGLLAAGLYFHIDKYRYRVR